MHAVSGETNNTSLYTFAHRILHKQLKNKNKKKGNNKTE